MASADEHLAQATHNEGVAGRLASAGDFDWAVTALFYSTLHLVQAYFVRAGIEVSSHRRRDQLLRATPELLGISESYSRLRARSENARYDLHQFDQAEYLRIEFSLYRPIIQHMNVLSATPVSSSDASANPEEQP